MLDHHCCQSVGIDDKIKELASRTKFNLVNFIDSKESAIAKIIINNYEYFKNILDIVYFITENKNSIFNEGEILKQLLESDKFLHLSDEINSEIKKSETRIASHLKSDNGRAIGAFDQEIITGKNKNIIAISNSNTEQHTTIVFFFPGFGLEHNYSSRTIPYKNCRLYLNIYKDSASRLNIETIEQIKENVLEMSELLIKEWISGCVDIKIVGFSIGSIEAKCLIYNALDKMKKLGFDKKTKIDLLSIIDARFIHPPFSLNFKEENKISKLILRILRSKIDILSAEYDLSKIIEQLFLENDIKHSDFANINIFYSEEDDLINNMSDQSINIINKINDNFIRCVEIGGLHKYDNQKAEEFCKKIAALKIENKERKKVYYFRRLKKQFY